MWPPCGDDFRSNEVSATITAAQAGKAKIEFMDETGIQILKDGLDLLPGTMVDATFMRASALRDFLGEITGKQKVCCFPCT